MKHQCVVQRPQGFWELGQIGDEDTDLANPMSEASGAQADSPNAAQAQVRVRMATYGKLEKFDDSADEWPLYAERLAQYFVANDVTDDDKKRAIFLSVCGRSTYHLVRNLSAPDKPSDKSFTDLCALLAGHYSPTPSAIVQRFKFHTRVRHPGESIATFVSELRKLSEHCDFGNQLDTMIRDRLVCGVADERIQRKLLAEPSTMTLKQASTIVIGMETASRNMAQLQTTPQASSSAANVHAIRRQQGRHASTSERSSSRFTKPQPQPKEQHRTPAKITPSNAAGRPQCSRCNAYSHKASECRFKDATCHSRWKDRPHREGMPLFSQAKAATPPNHR